MIQVTPATRHTSHILHPADHVLSCSIYNMHRILCSLSDHFPLPPFRILPLFSTTSQITTTFATSPAPHHTFPPIKIAMSTLHHTPPVYFTDSYKMCHSTLFPPTIQKLVAYGSFRTPFDNNNEDQRIVAFGIRKMIDIVARKWTKEQVEEMKDKNSLLARHYNG